MQKTTVNSQLIHQNRRGIAILWLILWGAMFLTFFCVVLEISSMWQAQVELKNTMDAAALAAVREWGLSVDEDTQLARNVGIAYMEGNPVQGSTVTVPDDNYNPGNTNQNASLQGSFVFGALETATLPPTSPIYFDPAASGSCGLGDVTITIDKTDGGASPSPQDILLEFNTVTGTPTNLEIKSVSFTLPTLPVNPGDPPDSQNAYFNDTAMVDTTAGSYSGVDPDGSPSPDFWNCPNGAGDICFEYLDEYVDGQPGHYGTVTLKFASGSMTQGDFFHFGVAFNNLGPPGYGSGQPNNTGYSWGTYPVLATVTFLLNGNETEGTAYFTPVGSDWRGGTSIARLTGSGSGYPAVIARASKGAQGFCSKMLGVSLFQVSATSVAYFDCSNSRTYLVNIENFPSLTLPPP